jgi:DNA-binding response OmpR family regulator
VTGTLSHQDRKKKILAVDNEPDMTTILKMALEREGFSVDTFNDPMLAIESFKPNLYSLAILDVMMPKPKLIFFICLAITIQNVISIKLIR